MKRNFLRGALILSLLLLVDSSEAQISKTFRVVNKTGIALTSVRISSSNANEWGLELNTMEKMPNNTSFEFGHKIDTARCMYDIKFTAEDGTEFFMKDVNFCQLKEIALVMPEEKGKIEEKPEEKKDK